ncbi:BrnA antitoxin family protein, partial [Acidithiobacillus ferrivorans]|nr:BrnA antitoxin family protein [Acidithiobacillus ferrivorans]
DVVAKFRASGPGWQTRIDAALKEWLETHHQA